jgi:DNA replication protein DnaC
MNSAISHKKYFHLKTLNKLSDIQKNEVFKYEQEHSVYNNPKVIEYTKKLNSFSDNNISLVKYPTKNELWKEFKSNFIKNENKEFDQNINCLENIKPLFYYFIGDINEFRKCNNVSLLSNPSLEKGLLIIGGYGVGKSSVMKALQDSLQLYPQRFIYYSANNIVTRYETCQTNDDKSKFFKEMTSGKLLFDDLTTEEIASNYGKIDILKRIIEERYDLKKTTHIAMNYDNRFPNDVKKALDYIGERYGDRVYDRIFEMFNVVEFTGLSMRK